MYALIGTLNECSVCRELHGMPGGLCPACQLATAKERIRDYEGGNNHAD